MELISFLDDYSEGCHPNIINALAETNLFQQTGYGEDAYSAEAKKLIRQKLNSPDSKIYFVPGGTQANLIVMSASLRSHEAVISAEIGHIAGHETGAIEATGHKVITMKTKNGKLDSTLVQIALDQHALAPHMVKPKLVYISNSTEIGTIYSKEELVSLSAYCKEHDLILFLDGARLGSALCSKKNDLSLEDIARFTDVFYIGGTKNGALLGEAIVINNDSIKDDFAFHIKQRGGLLSKGRVLGIQFLELFKNDLIFDLATHANQMAEKLSNALIQKGYSFLDETVTNQLFPVFSNTFIKELEEKISFHIWEKVDQDRSVVRLVTSWATEEKQVDAFIDFL